MGKVCLYSLIEILNRRKRTLCIKKDLSWEMFDSAVINWRIQISPVSFEPPCKASPHWLGWSQDLVQSGLSKMEQADVWKYIRHRGFPTHCSWESCYCCVSRIWPFSHVVGYTWSGHHWHCQPWAKSLILGWRKEAPGKHTCSPWS